MVSVLNNLNTAAATTGVSVSKYHYILHSLLSSIHQFHCVIPSIIPSSRPPD